MKYNVPEYVTLQPKADETAIAFFTRLLIEAARQCGLLLLEQTESEKPTAKNVSDTLSSSALAHELGHMFLHFAGVPIREWMMRLQATAFLENLIQDAKINLPTQ